MIIAGYVLLFAAGVLFGWFLHERATHLSAQAPQQTVATLSAALVDLCRKSLVLKGLPPHVADPETFTPSGISHAERESIETAAVDIHGETAETEAEMTAAMDRLFPPLRSKSG